jgi:hypothetical protein
MGLTIVRQDQSQLAVEMYVSLGVNLRLKRGFKDFRVLLVAHHSAVMGARMHIS